MSSIPNPILPFQAMPAPAAPGRVTVRALVERFLADRRAVHRAGGIGSAYLERLTDHLTDLAGAVGDLAAADLRPTVARQWICAHEQWKSPHTLENVYRALRALTKWGDAEELLDRDPLRSLKRFWGPPQPRGACTPEEYAALMKAARGAIGKRKRRCPASVRFRFQLWFLWHTGARTCELREALWEQVSWRRGLRVMSWGKTVKATGRARVIPLSDKVVRVLRWLHRRRQPGQKHIFCARGGRPLKRRSWDRLFRAYAERAGIRKEVTLYALRHGFCTEALVCGLGDSELAEIMGHTTTRYIRWYGRDLAEKTEHLRERAGRVHKPKPKPERPDLGSLSFE